MGGRLNRRGFLRRAAARGAAMAGLSFPAVLRAAEPSRFGDLVGRFLLPIQPLRPQNVRKGIFHGGDRDVDLYSRIDVGIKGTPMPAFGWTPDSPGALAPEDI